MHKTALRSERMNEWFVSRSPFRRPASLVPAAAGRVAGREEQSRARRGELMRGLREIYPSEISEIASS